MSQISVRAAQVMTRLLSLAGTTGTYDDTGVGGSTTLSGQSVIEQNFRNGRDRAQLDVVIASSALSAPLRGASYTANNAREWTVVGWTDAPGVTVLKCETTLGEGSYT